jgi:hypothetical protein
MSHCCANLRCWSQSRVSLSSYLCCLTRLVGRRWCFCVVACAPHARQYVKFGCEAGRQGVQSDWCKMQVAFARQGEKTTCCVGVAASAERASVCYCYAMACNCRAQVNEQSWEHRPCATWRNIANGASQNIPALTSHSMVDLIAVFGIEACWSLWTCVFGRRLLHSGYQCPLRRM